MGLFIHTFHLSSKQQYNENDRSFKIWQNMKREVSVPSLTTYYLKRKKCFNSHFFSRFEILCWKFVIIRRQKCNQTLSLVNNWMIREIWDHSSVVTLVTHYSTHPCHAITFFFFFITRGDIKGGPYSHPGPYWAQWP